MPSPRFLLAAAPLTLSALAHAGGAGGPVDWNRRAVQVFWVAQDDGTTMLHAAVQTQGFTPSSVPRDLSMNVEFRVNGVTLGSDSLVQLMAGGGTCPTATYAICGSSTFGDPGCAIDEPASGAGVCTASALASLAVPAGTIQAGDVLTAHLSPATGSLPELVLDDDATPATSGGDASDYIVWRKSDLPSATPAAGGDSFFDLYTGLTLGTDGTLPVDLSTIVEVRVNGVAVASTLVKSFATTHVEALLFPAVPCTPDDDVVVVLKPAPGSLPELPGLEGGETPVELPTLFADIGAISVSAGGTQNWTIQAGASYGGELYLILGTMSGTAPGIPAGGYFLPLNVDPYFFYTLNHPNSALLVNTFGALDPAGKASASLVLPFGSPPSLAGLTLHHAAVLLHPVFLTPTGATNAVELNLF